jgi:hypothetical protein
MRQPLSSAFAGPRQRPGIDSRRVVGIFQLESCTLVPDNSQDLAADAARFHGVSISAQPDLSENYLQVRRTATAPHKVNTVMVEADGRVQATPTRSSDAAVSRTRLSTPLAASLPGLVATSCEFIDFA